MLTNAHFEFVSEIVVLLVAKAPQSVFVCELLNLCRKCLFLSWKRYKKISGINMKFCEAEACKTKWRDDIN